MNITVDAKEPKDGALVVTLTVSAEDVDRAIKGTYKDISSRYTFQGFRRGRTPRPVIDAQIGREAVLSDATNTLLNEAEPLMLTELDVVPVGEVSYGEDVKIVADHEPYVTDATITLTPESGLASYDPVAIDMPPEEATEQEIENQINLLLSYQSTFQDVEGRAVQEGDFVTIQVENVEGAEDLEDESALIRVGAHASRFPHEIEHALEGMKVGESKNVAIATAPEPGKEGDDAEPKKVKVTVKGIRALVAPELTDELANEAFGFKTIEELKKGVGEEITQDKKTSLPELKEDRALAALTTRLEVEELPEVYIEQVFRDIANNVMDELQQHGLSPEVYAQSQGMTAQQFVARLHDEAHDHARESVALDALAKHLGIEVSDDEIKEQIANATSEDLDAFIESAKENGRLPSLRRSVKRAKALEWLVDNAEVTIVDIATQNAQAAAEEAETVEVEAAEAEGAEAEGEEA